MYYTRILDVVTIFKLSQFFTYMYVHYVHTFNTYVYIIYICIRIYNI
jgi:hypothetical protein